jgi:hypothetical protein
MFAKILVQQSHSLERWAVALAIIFLLLLFFPVVIMAQPQPTPPPTQWSQIVTWFITFVAGGLAGAIFNSFFTRHRQKVEVSLKVIDEYIKTYYYKHGNVNNLLDNSINTSYRWTLEEETLVTEVGDWFNFVSMLCNTNNTKEYLMKRFGIRTMISGFYNVVNNPKIQSQLGDDIDNKWPEMRRYVKKRVFPLSSG